MNNSPLYPFRYGVFTPYTSGAVLQIQRAETGRNVAFYLWPLRSPGSAGYGNFSSVMKLAPKLSKTLIELLTTCLLIILMFRWFEQSQVYLPDRVLTATPATLGRPFGDVRFKADDGVELNGWFFPASTNSHRAHQLDWPTQ